MRATTWGKASTTEDERKLLAGPQRRDSELVGVLKIAMEFIQAYRKLHFVGPCVTVFGSARFKEEHRYYQMARGATNYPNIC